MTTKIMPGALEWNVAVTVHHFGLFKNRHPENGIPDPLLPHAKVAGVL